MESLVNKTVNHTLLVSSLLCFLSFQMDCKSPDTGIALPTPSLSVQIITAEGSKLYSTPGNPLNSSDTPKILQAPAKSVPGLLGLQPVQGTAKLETCLQPFSSTQESGLELTGHFRTGRGNR